MLAAPGRHLPGLRVLRLGTDVWSFAPCVVLGPCDVCGLVRCCPGLQELWLVGAVQSGVEMTALTALVQLTGLTTFAVGGEAFDNEVAEQVLVQLTGLQQLCVQDAGSFTEAGLVVLTHLKQLQSLAVQQCGLEYEEWDEEKSLEFSSQASPPDVWQQLHAHCMKRSGCLRFMLKQLEGQLQDTTKAMAAGASAAKDEVASLNQHLAALQVQVAEAAESQAQLALAQQDAAAGQQQMAQMKQQLASAQQQEAQLQQQLAATKQQ